MLQPLGSGSNKSRPLRPEPTEGQGTRQCALPIGPTGAIVIERENPALDKVSIHIADGASYCDGWVTSSPSVADRMPLAARSAMATSDGLSTHMNSMGRRTARTVDGCATAKPP